MAIALTVLGLGVISAWPASANGDHQVSASVDFHDPSCSDKSASWKGMVNGYADNDHDGVTFKVTAGAAAAGASITVTATAAAGYVFDGGESTETFTHRFSEEPSNCGDHDVVVTPTVKFHNPDSQDQTASWQGYVNGVADNADDHVKFEVTAGTVAPGAEVTITATAEAGYVFPNGEKTMEFTHTFTQISGGGSGGGSNTVLDVTVKFHNPTPARPKPSFTGFVNGVADTATDHVTFRVTSGRIAPAATVSVTATTEAGFTLPGGVTSRTFSHTFTALPSAVLGAEIEAGNNASSNASTGTAGTAGSTSTLPTEVAAGLAGSQPQVQDQARVTGLLVLAGAGLVTGAAFVARRRRTSGAHRA